MKHVYEGKTKSVYELSNGNYLLKFKDDATGEGGNFDPGANSVGLKIDGMGKSSIAITKFFLTTLENLGIKTHYVCADIENKTMEVKKADRIGYGLEFICRFKATGSFIRRYGAYAKEGEDLDALIEITLKDDEKGDPVISEDALIMLGIITKAQYDELKEKTKAISKVIREKLFEKGLTLYDIKLEFGINNGEIILIDEIAGGNMRAYKENKIVSPLEIEKIIIGE